MTTVNSASLQTDYLQLLVTQLQNQDPLDPIDQESFIDQLTQLSVVEGLENLQSQNSELLKSFQFSQGSSLIGQNVEYRVEGQDELSEGQVSDVHIFHDGIQAVVNGDVVSLNDVSRIFA